MESLKLPKSGSGATTPTGNSTSSANNSGGSGGGSGSNVSVTVRFNAGDECVESIYSTFQNSSVSSGSGGGGGTGSAGVAGNGGNIVNNKNSPGSGGGGGDNATLLGTGGDSLASSPSQHQITDDQTSRNNFLQGNFFNRKSRSGSIEGISPTSSGPNLIGALTSGDTAGGSVGTWKLFKGKVSQTIEDIKSSKSNIPSAPTITLSKGHFQIELDSDQDNVSQNPSISDENVGDTADSRQQQQHQRRKHLLTSQQRQQQQQQQLESDSDIDNETLLEGDIERSRLRRGLANLKSKVKAKAAAAHQHHQQQQQQQYQQQQQQQPHHHQQAHPQATIALASAISSTAIKTALPKDAQQAAAAGAAAGAGQATSLRTTFLRKRRKPVVDAAEMAAQLPPSSSSQSISEKTATSGTAAAAATTTNKMDEKGKKKGVMAGRKDFEIESGVEMLEEMTPHHDTFSVSFATDSKDGNNQSNRVGKSHKQLPSSSSSAPPSHGVNPSSMMPSVESMEEIPMKIFNYQKSPSHSNLMSTLTSAASVPELLKMSNILPLTGIACLSAVLAILPVHDFLRGVVATFLGVLTLDTLSRFLNDFIIANPNQKKTFLIPDYSKMPILEIPAVEEHTIVKAYSGWMNEVNSYDPNDFHISMTKSVFVKLEGTTLRISSTTARIPKKVVWNEPAIDLQTITFTDHRIFDLLGCRIELLPIGLARKRYFNRKYPIQLIIRDGGHQEKRHEDNSNNGMMKVNSVGAKSKQASKTNSSEITEQFSAESVSVATQQPSSSTTTETTSNSTTDNPTGDTDMDFASTVLNADLQSLHDTVHAGAEEKDFSVPRGDEIRILLFSRADREKEDWYRRFLAASTGEVHEQNLRLPNIKLVHHTDFQASANKAAYNLTNIRFKDLKDGVGTTDDKMLNVDSAMPSTSSPPFIDSSKETSKQFTNPTSPDQSINNDYEDDGELVEHVYDENFEGLIMSACVSRNPISYVRFMANYQKACRTTHIPVYKSASSRMYKLNRKHRRARRTENELWKGIDQSLFLGPSGSVVWANVLLGRVIYSCLHDSSLKTRLQDLLQRKLSTVKLPSFMENVVITQIHLGEVSPLVHRVSQPLLDERGTWLDADITYEGFCYIVVTTKLNLLRMKRQARPGGNLNADMSSTGTTNTTNAATNIGAAASNSANAANPSAVSSATATATATATSSPNPSMPPPPIITTDVDGVSNVAATGGIGISGGIGDSQFCATQLNGQNLADAINCSAIFDSEAESSGGSSSESDSPVGAGPMSEGNAPSEGNARRLFKLVDRFTASNLFQYATEISYVQRAMENMNANITLRVDLRGLVARGVINLPPPPSDRVWLAFRAPPRLWITAKPTLGDKSVDWSIVTNVIESKLCEQVNRYLVYPNMVDITIPFLGQPTYNKE